MPRFPQCNRLGLVSLSAAFLLGAGTDRASADTANCSVRDQVIARLAEGYDETWKARHADAETTVMELFASDQTGSWTLTATNQTGLTCIVATGHEYGRLAKFLPAMQRGI